MVSSGLAAKAEAGRAVAKRQHLPAAAASDSAACSSEAAERPALQRPSQGPLQQSPHSTINANSALLQPSWAGSSQLPNRSRAKKGKELEVARQLPPAVQALSGQSGACAVQQSSVWSLQLPSSPATAVAAGQDQPEVTSIENGQVQLASVCSGSPPSAELEHEAEASHQRPQNTPTSAWNAGHSHPETIPATPSCCSLPVASSEHDEVPHDYAAIQALQAIDWSQVAAICLIASCTFLHAPASDQVLCLQIRTQMPVRSSREEAVWTQNVFRRCPDDTMLSEPDTALCVRQI